MATVSELLELARRQIGVKECPPNSNTVRYNTWYYGREVSGAAYPWCMVFVQWVFDQAGVKLPVRTASCGALMRAAKAAGCWVTKGYQPGDVVIYDFPGGAATDHCGIVESVDGTYISAIEGNTSSASDADGGAVERRARKFAQIVGAVRPSYDKEVEEVRYNTVLRYLRNVIMGIYFAALFHLVKYPLAKFFIMSDAELVEKGVMQ